MTDKSLRGDLFLVSFIDDYCLKIWAVALDIAAALKNNGSLDLYYGKRTDFWHLILLRENVLFEESPPSIMVTRNPNWSIEILWLEIGYVKGKILSPLKRSA